MIYEWIEEDCMGMDAMMEGKFLFSKSNRFVPKGW